MPNKYLIICGGHLAQGLTAIFSELDPKREMYVHVFEPVPFYADSYNGIENVELHPQAVWTYDGKVKLYMQPGFLSQGHSLCPEKDNVNENDFLVVDCIDFGKWLKGTFSEDDYLVARIDIEGGEYALLRSIIKDGSINIIDRLLVEFHHRKHKLLATEEEYEDIISGIKIPFEGFFSIKHGR